MANVLREQRGRVVASMTGGSYATLDGQEPPDFMGIIEWPDREAHKKYLASQTFAQNKALFQGSVKRFEAFHTVLLP